MECNLDLPYQRLLRIGRRTNQQWTVYGILNPITLMSSSKYGEEFNTGAYKHKALGISLGCGFNYAISKTVNLFFDYIFFANYTPVYEMYIAGIQHSSPDWFIRSRCVFGIAVYFVARE